ATIGTHQPSGFWTGKSHRPVAGDTRQREPGVSLIGSPGGASIISGNYHRSAEIVSSAAASLTHVAQAENGSRHRRRVRKGPGLTAIARSRGARVIGIAGVQIAAAYDAIEWVTEVDGEGASARRAC